VQPGGNFVQFDQRRVSDGFDDIVVDASHKNPFQTRLIDFVSQDCGEFGARARIFLSKGISSTQLPTSSQIQISILIVRC
jgi:hypothetical protein